jgi:hypothetical protein
MCTDCRSPTSNVQQCTHVSNRLSGELAAEFSGAEKSLAVAAAAGERTGTARLINILSFFGSCESLPQDLKTMDGASIWAGDGIHLTSNASRVAGEAHGRPSAGRPRRPGGRSSCKANPTGVGCPCPFAGQEEGGG